MLVLFLSVSVILLDQATKHWAQRCLPSAPLTIVPGFFDLRHVLNTGAAWGMFAGYNTWLVGLSVAMLACLVVFRRCFFADRLLHRWAMGLMVGGIVGNLTDRIRLQHVVDFLDFHWGGSHFPAFNVADSAICVGVGLYLLSQAMPGERHVRTPDSGAGGDGKV